MTTAAEKIEQRFTGRPDSQVPARVLARLTGLPEGSRGELVIDVPHKAIYGFATGAVADALAARDGQGPGRRHAARWPGRRSGAGPLPRRAAHSVRS